MGPHPHTPWDPTYARSDLRKAQQLVRTEAAAQPHGIDELPLLEAVYTFCDAVLSARWPQVQALAGALLIRSTMDGRQLETLVARLRRAQQCEDDWWHALAGWPLVFGAIWSMIACPELGPDRPPPPASS